MHLMLFHDFLRLVVAGQHSANDNAVDDVAIDDQFDDIGIVDDEGVDADNDSAPPGCGGGPASSCSASSATRRTSSFGSMA